MNHPRPPLSIQRPWPLGASGETARHGYADLPMHILYVGVMRLRVYHAATFTRRLRGLLGRPSLAQDEGLWIVPCNSVHSMGMGRAIDVVFLDAARRILKLQTPLRPWRASSCRGAYQVLELAAGEVARLGLQLGQILPEYLLIDLTHGDQDAQF